MYSGPRILGTGMAARTEAKVDSNHYTSLTRIPYTVPTLNRPTVYQERKRPYPFVYGQCYISCFNVLKILGLLAMAGAPEGDGVFTPLKEPESLIPCCGGR